MKNIFIAFLATLLAFSPGSWAASTGSLKGKVTPAEGVAAPKTVWITPTNAPGTSVSAPVAADGTFQVDNLPAGTAALAVETSEGLYVVNTPVVITAGTVSTLQLAYGGKQDTSTQTAPDQKEKKKKGGGVWSNPLYATLIVVGSAIVLGVLISSLSGGGDNNPPPASPSTSEQ